MTEEETVEAVDEPCADDTGAHFELTSSNDSRIGSSVSEPHFSIHYYLPNKKVAFIS